MDRTAFGAGACAALAAACLVVAATAARGEDAAARPVTTYPVRIDMAAASEGVDQASLAVSPDGAHVVWRAQVDGRWAWHVDGKRVAPEGGAYDEVGPIVFAPGGGAWAHLARRGERWWLVVEGAERPLEGLVPTASSLRTLPGVGLRVAFHATRVGEKRTGQTWVVHGAEGPAFPTIDPTSFAASADGRRHAYRVADGANERVVVDGQADRPYPKGALGTIVFSGDGRHVAYDARSAAGPTLVVDGIAGSPYERMSAPIAAPGGPHVLAVAMRDKKSFVLLDGRPGPEMDDVGAPGPILSADGAHYAYAGAKGGAFLAVVDGKEQPEFPRLGSESLRLSPDGKHHLYWAARGPRPFVVVDGVPGKEVDEVGAGDAFRFSPDSHRVAYAARVSGAWRVVTDGAEGPPTEGVGAGFPRFTPDSLHVVYQAKVAGRWHLFVDDKPGPAFDGFAEGALAFGQDGATVAVAARRGSAWRVVVDGAEGDEVAALLPGAPLVAVGPRAFRTWAARPPELLAVETALAPR